MFRSQRVTALSESTTSIRIGDPVRSAAPALALTRLTNTGAKDEPRPTTFP